MVDSTSIDEATTTPRPTGDVSKQKQLASGWNLPEAYSEQFVKESDEITKNIVNAIDVNSEMAVKSLEAITENFKTFNRTIDSFTEFNINIAKTWNSLYSGQQQQFLKQ